MRKAWLFALGLFAAAFLLHADQPPPTGPASEKRFPALRVPPGFKATLFACDPLIEYPSVIAIGPRPGAIFVAVDYMTGLGTDGKVKSEIRLVEDTDGDGYADKTTLIAGGFNSIQGLAYHGGTLFVMHAPFLTALKIPSPPAPLPKGEGRKDLLTGLGLTPEQNPVRLHCANGVVVGHDGWLYLAMGDNGVNVPRPEGDRLIHNGGCILRCRPDGRDLHVFSTGLRNIYDIALDSELNVFTRDNENDGGTYMIRVCHCFHGSDHGYPYLYERRPEEAMPPIGDFGLGSSAGGVCYLEAQFPPEYRGNLFFCEWGKSVVRYELKRTLTPNPSPKGRGESEGSGFAPVKEIEFAFGDPKDTYPFKPTDIIVQRDGTLMVSDYADGQRPKRGRGRIYHISFSRGSQNRTGQRPLADLNSESYFDRCETQAILERAGKRPDFKSLRPRGKLHAIWAMAKIDGPKAIEPLLQIAKSDADPGVRAQAIRAIADLADPVLVHHKLDAGRGDADLAEQIAKLSENQDRRIELEAVIALGRLRWTHAPAWMRRTLTKPDAALAHAWMQTLRRCEMWPEVMKCLDDGDTPQRKIAIHALAERYEPIVVDGLIRRLKEDKSAEHRQEYADLLARVYKKPGLWKYWGYRPGPKPANTEPWERTEKVAGALDRLLADADFEVRSTALRSMLAEKVPARGAALIDWLSEDRHPGRVASVLPALGALTDPGIGACLRNVVLDAKHSDANRLTALALFVKVAPESKGLQLFVKDLAPGPVLAEALRRYGKTSGADPALVATKISSADAEVRAAVMEALGDMNAKEGRTAVLPLLADKDVRVRRAAAAVAGKLKVKAASEPLLTLAKESDVGVRSASLEALRQLGDARVVPLAVAALSEPTLETAAWQALGDLGGPAQRQPVAEFGKRNPSTQGTIGAVFVLSAWSEKADPAAKKEIGQAIAEIHGASGMLVRWQPGLYLAVGPESRLTVRQPVIGPMQCEIHVAKRTPVEFLGSSDGNFKVSLNGRSIHERAQPGKFQIDSDRFTATLDAGVNHVEVAGTADFHLHFRRKSAKEEHEKLTQAALNRNGNAERGRKLFFDKEKSLCLKCHQIVGQGERIGPELTGVGSRFSRIHIIESILEPSRTIAPSFGTYVIALKNGKTLNGVKLMETETTLTIADNQGVKHELAKADIEESNPSPISIMPEGLEQRFTADEFVDLIAFLASQKDKRGP